MNYTPAIEHLQSADPILADIIAAVGPCTLETQPQGYVTLVDAIISQQISIQAAAKIMARLQEQLGELTPTTVLARSPEELRAIGLSNQKVRYLIDLSQRVLDGRLDLAHLQNLDDEAAIAALDAVMGIGRWTAEMYLIFALGRLDILPVDDLGLRQSMQLFYQLPDPAPAATLRSLAEPWRPYRSIATWYLWRGRRNIMPRI
jgi:DNA-3-methyladenine glycosylase II